MTTKYQMPEPHVHAELIKAWADGAVIHYESDMSGCWETTNGDPSFSPGDKYRISPICEYSIAKIAELGGDDIVDLYLYWLDGGELEFECQSNVFAPLKGLEDPFKNFAALLELNPTIRKKKRMVKQVMWVIPCVNADGESEAHAIWIEGKPNNCKWHKVPTLTREIEL